MKEFLSRVLRGDATREQAKDTGMALVLVFLLIWLFRRRDGYIGVALIFQLVTMTAPQVFRPIAVVWFGISHVMGAVASRVLLSLVFFVFVTPVGLWRRAMGADSLQLNSFGRGKESVMKVRNHTFVGQDLEQPY
jgi:hypothetical protein